MLEWDVVSGEQTQLEIIATLQGTELGQEYYKDLCDRQQSLKLLVRYTFVKKINEFRFFKRNENK